MLQNAKSGLSKKLWLDSTRELLYRRSGKERESRCLVFRSSIKREIKHFHVVVVQWRQRNVQKSVIYETSCCFPNLNPLLFCRSRWCGCHRCLALEFNSRNSCQHLTNWTRWNKRDKVWSSATSLFKWRFRSRRRRCCLTFLVLHQPRSQGPFLLDPSLAPTFAKERTR